MGERFEQGRIERCLDGGVMIGIKAVATDAGGKDDASIEPVVMWAKCAEKHDHWWDTCKVKALFNTPLEGGKTLKAQLLEKLDAARAKGPIRREMRTRVINTRINGQPVAREEIFYVEVPAK